jgi:uncharacterized integral membrane protein
MSALGALLKWVVLLPILVAVVLLAVANDQTITVHLNPFNVDDPVLRVNLALYQLAFGLFVLGALIGALVTWAGQHKYRSRSRHRKDEAQFWQSRAERAEQSERPQPSQQTSSRALAFLPRPERG